MKTDLTLLIEADEIAKMIKHQITLAKMDFEVTGNLELIENLEKDYLSRSKEIVEEHFESVVKCIGKEDHNEVSEFIDMLVALYTVGVISTLNSAYSTNDNYYYHE